MNIKSIILTVGLIAGLAFSTLALNSPPSNIATATTPNYPAPIASFTATPTNGVAPLTVNFTDTAVGVVTNIVWNFGDSPNESTASSPSHTYATAGVYTVTFTVAGPGGTATKIVTNAITVTPSLFPPTPSNLVAIAVSFTEIDLTWTNPVTNNIVGFLVMKSSLPTGPWTLISSNIGTATSYKDTNCTVNTSNSYEVVNFNNF